MVMGEGLLGSLNDSVHYQPYIIQSHKESKIEADLDFLFFFILSNVILPQERSKIIKLLI